MKSKQSNFTEVYCYYDSLYMVWYMTLKTYEIILFLDIWNCYCGNIHTTAEMRSCVITA